MKTLSLSLRLRLSLRLWCNRDRIFKNNIFWWLLLFPLFFFIYIFEFLIFCLEAISFRNVGIYSRSALEKCRINVDLRIICISIDYSTSWINFLLNSARRNWRMHHFFTIFRLLNIFSLIETYPFIFLHSSVRFVEELRFIIPFWR